MEKDKLEAKKVIKEIIPHLCGNCQETIRESISEITEKVAKEMEEK